MRTEWKHISGCALTAALLSLLIYLPSLGCGFVNWDDQDYILNNTAIRNLDWNLISWAFTDHSLAWWVPLTYISFAIDYHFWGLNPIGYHLTNILLHAANVALVVLIADRLLVTIAERERLPSLLQGERVWVLILAGLLFGIHPLRVESVAWATERKDVLSGFLFLGSFYQYLRYAEKRVSGRGAITDYLTSLILFAASLAAKPVGVVLPLLLLIADWYPFGRLNKRSAIPLMYEKLPYFAGSAALSVFMIFSATQGGALALGLSSSERLILSGNAIFEYIRMIIWPVKLIPLYIIPSPIPESFSIKASLFTALFVAVIVAGRRRGWLVAAWSCFLLPFLPVLSITQNGIQSHAARFTYLPSVILSVTVAILAGISLHRLGRTGRGLLATLLVALLLVYAAGTYQLIGVWKNSGTFWSRVIKYQPFDRAYFYRGLYYVDTGNFPEAVKDYSTCLEIAIKEKLTDVFNVYAFRGEAYYLAGRNEEAVSDFGAAIAMAPHPLYFYYRGKALRELGRVAESVEDLGRAGSAKGQMRWFSQ